MTATEPAPPPAPLPPAPSSGPKSGPSPGPGTGAGSGAGSGHAAPPDPAAALGVAEATWFAQLHSGSIVYDVPPEMTIAKPATVTVTINGYKAPIQPAQTGESAPAPLKVSEWMRVEATQPDNPDEFTISSDPSQNPQFVPIDSGATWSWTVTPNHIGSGLKLHFQAFVLYKDGHQQGPARLALNRKDGHRSGRGSRGNRSPDRRQFLDQSHQLVQIHAARWLQALQRSWL